MKLKSLRVAGLCSSALLFMGVSAHAAQPFDANQVQQIQQVVHNYLVTNPTVLVEASKSLQVQMAKKQEDKAMIAIKANHKQLFSDPNSPVAGNPKGTVTLVEFFDYQCGHCKEMNKTVQDLIKKNKNLRVVFKELPIFGDNSQYAAKVALAAMAQNKYFDVHEALLAQGNPLNNKKVWAAVKTAGLNADQLKKTMGSDVISKQLKNNFTLAQALGLAGTPAFVLANKDQTQFRFMPGAAPTEVLQKMVDQLQT